MKKAVLFDLGGTLVEYYTSAEFPEILSAAIREVRECLREAGSLAVSVEDIWARVEKENYEAEGLGVRPLGGRLARVFRLDEPTASPNMMMDLCRCFMKPIFERAQLCEDAVPALRDLRDKGLKTALVSNTPWGSPAELWREEVERLGLAGLFDALVFCSDVGWRKPDRRIFEFAMERLEVSAEDCLFVGDDPRWDLVGPAGVGMEAAIIDRRGTLEVKDHEPIKSLHELAARLL